MSKGTLLAALALSYTGLQGPRISHEEALRAGERRARELERERSEQWNDTPKPETLTRQQRRATERQNK